MAVATNLYGNVGGVTLAMENVGYDVAFTSAYDEGFYQTAKHNLNDPHGLVKHGEVGPDSMPVDFSNVHWVHGSPPCRGLTRANGANPGAGFDDERNMEMKKYIEWVGEIEPPIATLEMVTAVTYDYEDKGRFIDTVDEWWESVGYELHWQIEDARNFGTASRRRRCLMVAFPEDGDPDKWEWPEETHSAPDADDDLEDWRTKGEAIHDLPHVEIGIDEEDAPLPNHVPVDHSDHVVERLRDLPHGSNDWGAETNRAPCDEPAYTLECTQPVHCCEPRKLTIREMARLMDFPDDYEFVGNKPGKLGVGTTIPIRMGEAIGEAVEGYLERAEKV